MSHTFSLKNTRSPTKIQGAGRKKWWGSMGVSYEIFKKTKKHLGWEAGMFLAHVSFQLSSIH